MTSLSSRVVRTVEKPNWAFKGSDLGGITWNCSKGNTTNVPVWSTLELYQLNVFQYLKICGNLSTSLYDYRQIRKLLWWNWGSCLSLISRFRGCTLQILQENNHSFFQRIFRKSTFTPVLSFSGIRRGQTRHTEYFTRIVCRARLFQRVSLPRSLPLSTTG